MKVCYFGSYLKDYPRHRIIIDGLKQQGVEVVEVTSNAMILLRYPILFWKFLKVKNFDVIVVGEASNYVQPLAIFCKFLSRKPLIFDTFVSLYDTNQDRQILQYPLISRFFYYLDKFNCKFSDIVLQDTCESAKYFIETFNLPKSKFRRLFIGAEDKIFHPLDFTKTNNKFKVLFYGTYIPLHGVQYIIQAAKILEKYDDIEFQLIGNGQTFNEMQNLKNELRLNNLHFLNSVPYINLPEYIVNADVCLGIFGGTSKSMRVIPTKAYQILAMGKPLLTGYSKGTQELLISGENSLLCNMADSKSLAESIILLKKDIDLRNKIADGGFKLFEDKLSSKHIGKLMLNYIKELTD